MKIKLPQMGPSDVVFNFTIICLITAYGYSRGENVFLVYAQASVGSLIGIAVTAKWE